MQVLRPHDAEEAVAIFGRTPHAMPLAGGTDFMVAWNIALLNNKTILDLSGLKEWIRITSQNCNFKTSKQPAPQTGGRNGGRSLRIGSLVTHTQLQEHPLIRKEFSLLAQACSMVGGVAIQNRGTLGGNIANASPAGDTFPPLAIYEAIVHMVSPQGRRSIPFLEVFTGAKKTALRPSELIEAIEIPIAAKRPTLQLFRKVGTRAAQALSKTVAAGLLWLSKDDSVEELRFALGSMAPTVRRLKQAEIFVKGKKLTEETVYRACELLATDVSPIDDIRSTREYRLHVSQNILRNFLNGGK